MPKTVAVIIVGTNEKKWLPRCLETLTSSIFQHKLLIVYVDNNSTDGSVDYIKTHFSQVIILRNSKNLGFAGANNQGIAHALTLNVNYIFFVNPDTATPPNLIQQCFDFMELHSDVGAIGPMQTLYNEDLNNNSPTLNAWSQQALLNGEKHPFYLDCPAFELIERPYLKSPKIEHLFEHSYVQGAALFVVAKILQNYGGFDPLFHTFYEEVDLCRRIRWLGYRVGLLTHQFIQHYGGGSTHQTIHKQRLMMRNRYYFILTDPTWNIRQIGWLFRRWFIHDIKRSYPQSLHLLILNVLWILFRLPEALVRRFQNHRIARGRYLEFIPKDSYE